MYARVPVENPLTSARNKREHFGQAVSRANLPALSLDAKERTVFCGNERRPSDCLPILRDDLLLHCLKLRGWRKDRELRHFGGQALGRESMYYPRAFEDL